MSEFIIACRVPAYVYIEFDGGEATVTKVVVDDEALVVGRGQVEDCHGTPIDPATRAGARTIRRVRREADDCQDWPAWEFGF